MVSSGYKCLSCGKVEAGDRALETARKIHDEFIGSCVPKQCNVVTEIAALIREASSHNECYAGAAQLLAELTKLKSAMNAQERELVTTLRTAVTVYKDASSSNPKGLALTEWWLAEAERLLAERGEG